MREEEIRLYWLQCLQMALAYNPESAEEQIKIATALYESDKELNNKNKTFLEKTLERINN